MSNRRANTKRGETPGSRGSQRLYPNEALIRFVKSYLAPRQCVLEVGCGDGGNLWMLAAEGHDAHGIDIRGDALTKTSATLQKYGLSAKLSETSWLDITYDDETFDAIIDIVALQHTTIHDSHRALSEVSRVLKPGGWFFSYRLSSNSGFFKELAATGVHMLDEVTVEQIPDPFPLSNNGLTSFWSADMASQTYPSANLIIQGIDRHERTTADGEHVEYLGITARKI